MRELPRQVIRERRFERELRALISDARVADAYVEGAEFVLAREPEAGEPISPAVWVMPMAPVKGRQVALYYAFDESTVWLLSIASV